MKQTLNHLTTTKQKIVRHRRVIISALVGAGLSFGLMGNANAHCVWYHPGHCAEDVANDIEDTANDIADAVNDIANDIEAAANDVANQFENWANDIEDFINDMGDAILRAIANAAFDQVADPMTSLAKDWATLIADDSTAFNRLADAVKEMNAVELSLALDDVLASLFVNTSFKETVKKFKEEGAGSILFIAGAGGGAIVTAEVDVGIAMDIDYIIHRAEGNSSSSYGGSVASLFSAVGVQVGASVGGGVDAIVGYHMSSPTGVGGPGIDITLGLKTGVGGSVSIGIDASTTSLPVVTGSIGLGAGAEIELDIGPSYAGILAHLCSDGSLELLTTDCSSTGSTDSTNTVGNTTLFGDIPTCGILNEFGRLYAGEVLESCNGEYRLSHQYDGNIVIYNAGTAIWSTQTGGESTSFFTMQGDGNLVLYGDGAVWASRTNNTSSTDIVDFLYLTDSGALRIYSVYYTPTETVSVMIWDSGSEQ